MRSVDVNLARQRLFATPGKRVGNFAIVNPAAVMDRRLSKGKGKAGGRVSLDLGWQAEAYELSDRVGEIGYVHSITSSAVSKGNLRVEKWDPGTRSWDITEDPQPHDVMEAFVGPYGGQAELKRRGALHLSIAGEANLLAIEDPTAPLACTWEFLSVNELRINAEGKYERRRDGSGNAENLPDDVYVARLWRSDPNYSDRATSPMKRVMLVAREVDLLTQVVEAIAKTNLPAGLLYMPEEVDFDMDDAEEDVDGADGGDEDEPVDPLTKAIIEHLSSPVENRLSVAALVPLLMRGPGEQAQNIKLIELARELDRQYVELRQEALGRLARGLDIPPEIMEGKGGLNHWTGYNIDQDFVAKHVVPTGDALADFITCAYLRPVLTEYHDVPVTDAAFYRVTFDPSPLNVRSDAPETAMKLWEADLLADGKVLEAHDYDEGDMPDEDQLARRVMMNAMKADPKTFVPIFGPQFGVDISPEQVLAATTPPQLMPGPGGPGRPDEPRALGPGPEDGAKEPTQAEFARLVDRIGTAADAALERARERAGSKLVSRTGKDITLADRLRSLPKTEACTVVSTSELLNLGLTAEKLIDTDAWTSLALRTRDWLRTWHERCGFAPRAADEAAAEQVHRLVFLVNQYALHGLHRPMVLNADGLRIPLELIVEALTTEAAAATGA